MFNFDDYNSLKYEDYHPADYIPVASSNFSFSLHGQESQQN